MNKLAKSQIVFILVLLITIPGFALTDTELTSIRAGFESRRNIALQSEVDAGLRTNLGVSWANLNYAVSALYLAENVSGANQKIIDTYNWFIANPDVYTGEFGLHWVGPLICRIYELYNHDSKFFPGRLTTESENCILTLLWGWAKVKSSVSDANVAKVWYIWGSENHDAMRDSTSWGAAKLLKDVSPYNTYLYDDGHTALEHYMAWTDFHKQYLRERSKKGQLIEVASKYNMYTLQGWYNFYDFGNTELSYLAGCSLDLWWTDWAHDQIDAVQGGGKSRVYPGSETTDGIWQSSYTMGWYYLGTGQYLPTLHRATLCLATSNYRMPLVIIDIAMDRIGKGSYEYKSRRQGLAQKPKPLDCPDDSYAVNPDVGGIYRYSYCTPEFIIGTCMVEKRPNDDWTLISSQNRWQGVIFRGDPNLRIVPRCQELNSGTYNEYWSVQNKRTLITQKLSTSINCRAMRVFFSTGLNIAECNNWVFAVAPGAYAAVRPAYGGYYWQGNWLICNDCYAPVIIETALKTDFNDFTHFQEAVSANSLSYNGTELNYHGLLDSGIFVFYTNSNQAPLVNGVPLNYIHSKTFESPFIDEQYGQSIVYIQKDARKLALRFNETGPLSGDFNNDGYIDFLDFALFAHDWLVCTDPVGLGCIDLLSTY